MISAIHRYRWMLRLFIVIFVFTIGIYADYFSFLSLNLILAYLPLEISLFIWRYQKLTENVIIFGLFLLIWLLFYPNAPYLITDFFHLSRLPYETQFLNIEGDYQTIFSSDSKVWLYFSLMVFGVFTGITAGFISLRIILNVMSDRLPFFKSLWIVSMVIILSSYAIYIGRFERIHSVDVFFLPISTVTKMLKVFLHLDFWYFFMFMTFVQAVLVAVWYRWIFDDVKR
jgi:uncharacterized membrane protein